MVSLRGGAVPVVSSTINYATFTWTNQEWTGNWITDATGKKVKEYTTVTHATDQLPAYYDANGVLVLYTEGDNKAVLSANVIGSTGTLKVNGMVLAQY